MYRQFHRTCLKLRSPLYNSRKRGSLFSRSRLYQSRGACQRVPIFLRLRKLRKSSGFKKECSKSSAKSDSNRSQAGMQSTLNPNISTT